MDIQTVKLPGDVFHYMARASQAHQTLTPPEVEQHVLSYLRKLDDALAAPNYDPNMGVHALVFGEWGHGKSHVLYRTAGHLRTCHSGALTVKVIPEALNPEEILRAVHRDLIENNVPSSCVTDALMRVVPLSPDDRLATTEAIRALLQLAIDRGTQHAVFLFDEAQTMANWSFQNFLQELRSSFCDQRINLHTMQCHSLATLDRARQISQELGPWLLGAVQIHLPGVLLKEAHAFYRQRLLSSGVDATAADHIVPDGVSRALCEAAGGNPRKMLQYADALLRAAVKAGDQMLGGVRLLEVFSTTAGVKAGSRLFMQDRFERILNLLPQELKPEEANTVGLCLRKYIGRLFGEYWRPTVTDLLPGLGVGADQLPALTKQVDGKDLFNAHTDQEYGITEYALSPTFRAHLSEAFGSTGSIDLKQLQFGALLNPTRYQVDAVEGLGHVLKRFGIVVGTPTLAMLGEFDDTNPVRGWYVTTKVSGTDLEVPTLVTAFWGVLPPQAAIEIIARQLKARRCLRAYVFFSSEECTWQQLESRREFESVFASLAGNRARFCAIESAEWQELVKPNDADAPQTPGVQAAQFFANLISIGQSYADDIALPQELTTFAGRVATLMQRHEISMEDLCYLPSERERDMLDHRCWSNGASLSLGRLRDAVADAGITTNSLAPLLADYLDKSGRGYVRRAHSKSGLYQVTATALRRQKEMTIDGLCTNAAEQLLTVGDSARLKDNIVWVINQHVQDGTANLLGDKVQFVDIASINRSAKNQIQILCRECEATVSKVRAYAADYATPLAEELEGYKGGLVESSRALRDRALTQAYMDLQQKLQRLKNDCDGRWKMVEEEQLRWLESLAQLHATILECRRTLPEAWQELILSTDELREADSLLSSFRSNADSRSLSKTILSAQYRRIAAKLEGWQHQVTGRLEPQPGEEIRRILNLVASRTEFVRVTVTFRGE